MFLPRFPSSINEFAERNRERYADPAQGVRVGYVTPEGLGADAFLYPSRRELDTSAAGQKTAAREEAVASAAVLTEMAARGEYSDVVLAAPEDFVVTGPAGRPVPGAYIAVSLRQQGRPALSDVYVFALGRRFLKIRATYPDDAKGKAARAAVQTFTTGLATTLEERVHGR
jgi:hypothetical protein